MPRQAIAMKTGSWRPPTQVLNNPKADVGRQAFPTREILQTAQKTARWSSGLFSYFELNQSIDAFPISRDAGDYFTMPGVNSIRNTGFVATAAFFAATSA